MSRPPGKDGGSITDSDNEEEVQLNQGGSDNGTDLVHQSDSESSPALVELEPLTSNKNQNAGSPRHAGRLSRQVRRQSSAARMPIYEASSRTPFASGSRQVVEYDSNRVVMPPRPMQKATRSKIPKKRRRILKSKSPSPVLPPSPCSSGFPWSPVSTSTIQPMQVQPRASVSLASVNPTVPSTSVHQLAPRSEFLSWIPSPSGLTHNEAYQQAQILATRRLDLEIELQQTEELLSRMTKKLGKGKAKEE
ncbi:hypothetical protein BJ165DRAFT_1408582 [Panaeolus papilionaceus]|nr:hypothetical protein BJ165DRAFT_1408582 [Panaeolus papilionaceus]